MFLVKFVGAIIVDTGSKITLMSNIVKVEFIQCKAGAGPLTKTSENQIGYGLF